MIRCCLCFLSKRDSRVQSLYLFVSLDQILYSMKCQIIIIIFFLKCPEFYDPFTAVLIYIIKPIESRVILGI